MSDDKRASRRRYSAEFKAQVLAECEAAGASVAKVAMAHGINDNVVHEHLHAVGTPVGEQVRMVRPRGAEDVDDAAQRGFGTRTHVQRLHREPDGIDSDHRSSSRIQDAKSTAADSGQVSFIVTAPRRNSTS